MPFLFDEYAAGIIRGIAQGNQEDDVVGSTAVDKLLRLFERFDVNRDGLIDEHEFSNILDRLGWTSPEEVRSLEFAAIDSDSDGLVEFQEFADWWLDQN